MCSGVKYIQKVFGPICYQCIFVPFFAYLATCHYLLFVNSNTPDPIIALTFAFQLAWPNSIISIIIIKPDKVFVYAGWHTSSITLKGAFSSQNCFFFSKMGFNAHVCIFQNTKCIILLLCGEYFMDLSCHFLNNVASLLSVLCFASRETCFVQ